MLTVDERGLIVSAPWRSTERRITGIIRDAEDWVLSKLAVWSVYPSRNQSWADGDTIKYLGRDLRLNVREDSAAALATLSEPNCLRVALPEPRDAVAVRTAVLKWYRRHATSNFTERVGVYACLYGLAVPRLFLSGARTRWGSCNVKREVRLNWRLIQAPQPTIDYVVAHELAHLVEMNHSRRFWNLVAAVCPHHRQARAELDHVGRYYMDI
jgi:predicted metal-dependent hydrolase